MKRLLGILVLCLFVFASVASATQTRVQTLGDVDHIIKDDFNIWTFPQSLTLYPNRFIADIDGSDLHSIGAHLSGCLLGSMAMYFSTHRMVNVYAPLIEDPDGNQQVGIDQKIDLFWAREFNTATLGLALSYYGNSHKKDFTADQTTKSATGLGLTLGATFMSNIDAYFAFNTYTWTDEDSLGNKVTEPSGNTTIEFGGRYWLRMSDNVTLVPYGAFALIGEGVKDAAGNEITYSTTAFMLGVGHNINAGYGVLAVTDLGIRFQSSKEENKPVGAAKTEDKAGLTNLPYFRIGLESEVSEKVDIRFGAVKMWSSRNTEDNDGNKESWGFAGTDLYVGVGLHFGDLDIDANVDPGFFTRGPYLLSGQTGDMAFNVSLRYVWD